MDNNELFNTLAGAIKKARKEDNISVIDLAKKMGCSASYIRMVEAGIQGMSLKKLGDFANALDRDIEINFPKKEAINIL